MNGPEMMLRSLGLGEVLDAAKAMAQNGAVEKILKFADGVGELNERLGRIEKRLGLGELQRLDLEAGPGSGGMGPGGDAGGGDVGVPEERRTA